MTHRIQFGEQQEGQQYVPRIGVYAVVQRFHGGKVAVIKNERGHYFLPGGGLDLGENHEACLKRELIEETGYDIQVGPYIGQADQYHMSFRGDPILGIGHFYLAEMLDRLREPIENGELMWLDTIQAIQLLFLQNQAWAVREALQMF